MVSGGGVMDSAREKQIMHSPGLTSIHGGQDPITATTTNNNNGPYLHPTSELFNGLPQSQSQFQDVPRSNNLEFFDAPKPSQLPAPPSKEVMDEEEEDFAKMRLLLQSTQDEVDRIISGTNNI